LEEVYIIDCSISHNATLDMVTLCLQSVWSISSLNVEVPSGKQSEGLTIENSNA